MLNNWKIGRNRINIKWSTKSKQVRYSKIRPDSLKKHTELDTTNECYSEDVPARGKRKKRIYHAVLFTVIRKS